MAKTLLETLNAVLKRVKIIAGDNPELTGLTDSTRQHDIDLALQVISEGVDDLYNATSMAFPNVQSESTITLATGTRSYPLAADLVRLRWPLIDKANNQFIHEFPGGYNAILLVDPELDDAGLSHFAAISPVDGELFLRREPTAADNGNVYTYQYDKDFALNAASDVMPFNDAVWRAMIPVFAEFWRLHRHGEFRDAYLRLSRGRAAQLLTQQLQRTTWSPR